MTELIQMILMLGGASFVLTAGIGLVKFPDALSRSHAISKALTLGLSGILLALLFTEPSLLALIKVAILLVFQFVTIPLAGHIFARYAIDEKSS